MRAQENRTTVSQDHLDRSAAAIAKMERAQGKAARQPARYGFLFFAFDQVLAFRARPGAKTVTVDCRKLEARIPATDLEREAVQKLEARRKLKPQPVDVVAKMAHKIVQAAGRGVLRKDFHQAGIADADINPNFDKAMAMARRIDPAIDAIQDIPWAA